jgi:peptide/nickel transport system substrate-binding protein
LPQHVWDRQMAGGPIGDYDTTAAGAQAVYKFLDQQASSIATYDTNPLWQVVDGPWKLKRIDSNGNVAMVPNARYSGPVHARIAEFDEVPFSKYVNEYNALRNGTTGSGAIDYGYLPVEDVVQKDSFTSLGYSFVPWTGWLITDFPTNLTNPTSGPIFQQLYFRQAMQMLVDQSTMINNAFSGYAYATYGPVPARPPSTFVDAAEQNNSYPFSPAAAVMLLQSHGWTVNPGGVSTCTNPGTVATQCGGGIAQGQKASFHLEYVGGNPALDKEMQQLKADFSMAGIEINLSTNPSFEAVIANATPCIADKPCTWDMEYWGYGWIYSPDYYPTGDQLFGSSAPSNYNGWHDAMTDQLIQATETSGRPALYAYEAYIAKQLPVVWLPTQYIQLSEISSRLQGTQPQDPLGLIYPENWTWQ